jgi:Domain of unknown function (DUF4831)
MKTILKLSLYFLTSILVFSCSSSKKLAEPEQVVLPLNNTSTLREGSIVYALPRTVLTFTVEFERTIEKPGPYARYAGELLGLDKVITAENETWSIEGIAVNSREELDPSEYYIIESNSLFQTNVLELRKEGLILDLNPQSFYSSGNFNPSSDQDISQFSNKDLGSDEYYMVQNDTAYKRLSIDSSFVRVPYVVEKKRRLTTDQLAERAAKRLMEMREGKHMILTGEANVFPQSDAAINELNRLEKEYMELFTGKTIKQKILRTYRVIPNKDTDTKPIILFQFSELTGPVSSNGKGGTPVTLEIAPEQRTKDLVIIRKKTEDPKSQAQTYDKLYYRVPDVVNLKVSKGQELFLNSRKLVYQFGEVVQLPANFIIGK